MKAACASGLLVGLAAFAAFKTSNDTPVKIADLKMPGGFTATIVADSLGPIRHIEANAKGDIYARKNFDPRRGGKGVFFLTDTNHDGRLDKKLAFGDYPGTGVKIKDGYLYSSSNSAVFRYKLDKNGQVIDPNKPETIVTGLLDKRNDNSKSLALDDQGNLYVTVGSWSDACRQPKSAIGIPGCPILDSAAGVWKFKASKQNQTYSDGVRFATGLKNVVGIDYNPVTKSVFAMPHGRSFDKQSGAFFVGQKSSELPAETMYELTQGLDAGWPFTYYDQQLKKSMLAPEYGGDGAKPGDSKFADPVISFPGHLAPNAILFYTGNMFPKRYKNGAFIAFHGRSVSPTRGYFVAFVPFVNGKPTGEWEVFADNFTGQDLEKPTGPYKYRPMGLAQGPDGALYVSDDFVGAIFKITYK
ncbi:sorbosone dehydrogenase family protein [Mucilaginibacter myungsuensis]